MAGAPPSLLSGVARLATRLLRVPVALVCESEGTTQRLRGAAGLAGAQVPGPVPLAESLCLQTAGAREPLLLENARADLRFRRDLGLDGLDATAFAGVPLLAGGRVRGTLAVLDVRPRRWSPDELAQLQELAALAATELERELLERENEELATALWRSEASNRQLLEDSRSVVFTLDAAGVVTALNRMGAEVLGRPVAEVVGRDLREFLASEDRPLVDRLLRRRAAEGWVDDEVEACVLRPTGERRVLRSRVAPMLEAGAVVGLHGVARDVTEERTRETQFRRAERMASVAPLLGGICHELNNPLTSIKSFAELLLLDERPAEDREALEIVRREAHRAARIVADLRVVARQSQEVGAGRELVDLSALVRCVLEPRQPVLSDMGITVHETLRDPLPPVWAVRAQLEQVVVQLVTNAVQAVQGKDGPRELLLRTHRGGIGLVLQVEDTGPGIPQGSEDRIFDPFWTTRAPGEGTGLGLSLVHSIVTEHGGSVRVEGRPGRGARFTVELPVAEQPLAASAEPGARAPARAGLHILVADDEPGIRYSLTRYMQRRGHRVVEVGDGATALRELEEAETGRPFDIILADLRMPGLSGRQFWERLRERGDTVVRRLIFITGDADSPDAGELLQTAGVPVVRKPFELAEIAQIIEIQAATADV